jgi:SAM-dependent methyltransferase
VIRRGPQDDIEREAARVRNVYEQRAERGLDARYAYWQPANLYIYQQRERDFLAVLRAANMLPLTNRRVLDAGCGDGGVLRDLLRYGAEPSRLHGVDLLPDRVERARELTPGAVIDVGDVQALRYATASFDLVLGFTLFSSIVGAEARRRVAAELLRVTRPGGRIVLYDFWINPTNRSARPLRRNDVRRLFAGHDVSFRSTTLAPPLVRLLAPLPGGRLACTLLEVIPFLRTHFLAAIVA